MLITPNRRSPRGQFIGWLAVLPFAWAVTTMLQLFRVRDRPVPVLVPPDVPLGLSLRDEVVLHRGADGRLRAFAARCTHLGCRLDRVADDVIVCPCHGSRFFSDGRVAAGPAAHPLTELRVRPDAASGGWTIDGV
jgi:nitrite reductase/ring-hydroxylating ferredoxin subunit